MTSQARYVPYWIHALRFMGFTYSIILIVDMRLVFSQEASRLDDDDNHSFTAGSQERYDSNLTATTPVHTQKYVDPFNPNSVIKPLSANQRRWVHTFPIGQYLPVTKSFA